jgi:transcriptional regulator with XRE-family HTH domain
MVADGEAFGRRLRARRVTAGLSQRSLAQRSGLSVRMISDLERGRTRWPYPDSLRRLADALDLAGGGAWLASDGRCSPSPLPSRGRYLARSSLLASGDSASALASISSDLGCGLRIRPFSRLLIVRVASPARSASSSCVSPVDSRRRRSHEPGGSS